MILEQFESHPGHPCVAFSLSSIFKIWNIINLIFSNPYSSYVISIVRMTKELFFPYYRHFNKTHPRYAENYTSCTQEMYKKYCACFKFLTLIVSEIYGKEKLGNCKIWPIPKDVLFFTFSTLYNSRTTFLVQVMYYNEFVQLMYYIKEFQITYYVVHYSLWPSFVFLEFWHSTKDVLYLFDFVQISYYIFILFSFIQYKKIIILLFSVLLVQCF